MRLVGFFMVMLFFGGGTAVAQAVPVGYVSFDSFIPGPAGVNAFGINNLTGDPAGGGSALPPDFPVFDPLTFLGGTLTLTLGDGSGQVVSLGDIGPGPFLDASGNPPAATQFADTTHFVSATFAATLSQASFLLSDGTVFIADSSFITMTLLPSSGLFLVAGSDFGVLDAAPRSMAVSEPTTLLLLASSLAIPWAWKRRK